MHLKILLPEGVHRLHPVSRVTVAQKWPGAPGPTKGLGTEGSGAVGAGRYLCVAAGRAGKSLRGSWVRSLPLYLLVCNWVSHFSGLSPKFCKAAMLRHILPTSMHKVSFLS